MATPTPATGPVRLAELIAALSLATDLAMSQPLEFALRSCIVAMRLGEVLGLDDTALREVFYQSLLRYIGCNAETHAMAALFGDEMALREDIATVDTGNVPEVMRVLLRHVWRANAGSSPLQVARAVTQGIASSPRFLKGAFTAHCEVAQRLAERLGFDGAVVQSLGQLYERWDGRGMPNGLRGESVARSVRIVSLAQDVVTVERIGGLDAAMSMARERRGTAYDPRIADEFCARAASLLTGIDDEPSWDAVLALEPAPRIVLTDERLGLACGAIADFTDIKSPFTVGHSTGVAALAADAARRCGLPEDDVELIRRAGLVHDVGRVGVSAGVWGKAGPLSDREWERVRLHPYYTDRVLARPATFARLGALASLHHERLDGSGYHRGLGAAMLSPAARILAAADVYHAMLEPRPHRPAHSRDEAATELRREVRAARLDGDAVGAVLDAAGHRASGVKRAFAHGLSDREVQVLRLIARGHSIRETASRLTISEKTVDNHIQHIYTKIDVRTRAGATMYAMEHNLVDPDADAIESRR